jgi:hypothetical protein
MSKRKISIDEAVKEVMQFAKEFKNRNGSSSLRIPNKDFNLWLVNSMIRQNGRIGKLEVTTKVLLTLFCGLAIKIIIL